MAPSSFDVRPTTDFAKEGLFNVLDNFIEYEALDILDLFAGTGNISYEFLSRGAKNATAVEANKRHAHFIQKTGETLFAGKMRVIISDVFKFLEKSPLHYDFIFADPPYELENIVKIPDLVFASQNMKPGMLFVLEHSADYSFSDHPNFSQERKYGKVHFTFFNQKSENNSPKQVLEIT